MKTIINKDLVTRAALTFVQAFVAALVVLDEPFTANALLAALASAGSVVWHKVAVPTFNKVTEKVKRR